MNLQEKFNKELKRHKKLIAQMVNEGNQSHPAKKYNNLIPLVVVSSKELALVYSKFKCERCGNENTLQFHHLITRHIKEITDHWKYMSQRNYWANIVVLCKECHLKEHDGYAHIKLEEEGGCISDAKIWKIKKKFGVMDCADGTIQKFPGLQE
jgi:5-methylcytosine-specific restriction endonuclease McrA